jgi:hypothetical protein
MALSERDYRHGTRNRIKGPGTGTSDDIPAMLSNGEFVVKASSAAKIGDKALNHMNRTGRVPMGPMMQQMKQGRMRGKRRVKMGLGGLISKLGAGAAALYGGKKIQDRFTTPTHNKDLAAASEGGSGGGALAPSAPVSPNPNYGGVVTPSNQGATNALEERIRRAGGAKGGYVIRRKKMNLGGAAKAAGWLTVAALTGYAGKKGIEEVQRLNKERKERMKEVEAAAAAATPEKKYGGGYAWPRKQMMHGGKGLRAATGMAGGGHPGFKAVQAKIARKSGVPMKNAGAILAAASRRASPAAKRANPRLNRVKG